MLKVNKGLSTFLVGFLVSILVCYRIFHITKIYFMKYRVRESMLIIE